MPQNEPAFDPRYVGGVATTAQSQPAAEVSTDVEAVDMTETDAAATARAARYGIGKPRRIKIWARITNAQGQETERP